ncbi:phospholipase D gamma 1-like [Canna indica]|uniref:phospholipase D n=1 Tax=Canna indica TaxID=4628 RepID=A0AAQ3QE16_9LILI|nr:phospholipase D gamma 1-like [Canna indica]
MENNGDPYHPYLYGYQLPYQYPPPRQFFPSISFSSLPPQYANYSGPLFHPPPPYVLTYAPMPYPLFLAPPHDQYYIPPVYPSWIPFGPNPPSFYHQVHYDHLPVVAAALPSYTSPFQDNSQHFALPVQVPVSSSSVPDNPPAENVLANVRLPDFQTDVGPSATGQQDAMVRRRPSNSLDGRFSSPRCMKPSSSFSGSYNRANFSRCSSLPVVPYGGPRKSQTSLKVLLLHGSLDVWVCEARNLPNKDQFSKTLGDMIGPRLSSTLSGKMRHLSSMTSDPYVNIMVCGATIGRTYVLNNTENPVWMQYFSLPVAHHTAEVRFVVKDNDLVGAQLIGSVSIPAEWIYSGERIDGVYPIFDSNGKQCKKGSVLRLVIQYFPVERLSMYHHGISADPYYCGVPGTYFPLRKGGNVKLYQDAHVPDGCLPELKLENGMNYVHGKCWHDIFDAISQARRLIYIIGWSVFHRVRLVRDAGCGSCPTLGDLLKSKSQEGVRVLLLVWDDPTSKRIFGIRTSGVMGTHDEETRHFFKHSSVQVLLCPRSAGKRHSFAKQQEIGTIYTHHQKQVVVDTDAGENKRKITAFLGGLDLCGGRYDNPEHPLFRTSQSLHEDDYHNPTFVVSDNSAPREPWHDLHARIEGPAAYDVLKNFEERWLKASKRHGIKKLKKLSDDALLKIERIPDIIAFSDSAHPNDNDPETWHVQVFRSIDSNSAKGFPKDPRVASHKNLVCGKNVLIDMSIQTAYINAIRAAQHFIYIENQYFLGSSFNWDSNNDLE